MRFKIERLGGNQVMHTSDTCANCGDDAKCRRRDFSEQAWSALVLWGEVAMTAVDQPVCEHCYAELRDVLIDRADDIAAAVSQAAEQPQKLEAAAASRSAAKAASPQRVRRAG